MPYGNRLYPPVGLITTLRAYLRTSLFLDREHQRGRSILDQCEDPAAKGIKDPEHLDFDKIEEQRKQNELHLQKSSSA